MQDIHGSIHIPIKHKAAGAAVNPIGKCFRVNRAASRAGLAGIGRVHQFHSLASVFSFVRQAVNELAPRCIVDGLGEHPARQPLHIQILQHDAVVLGNKPLAGGVDEFLAFSSDSPVNLLNLSPRRLPPGAAFLPSSKHPAGLAKLAGIVFGELRQGQRLTFAGGDEAGQAHVDADDTFGNHRHHVGSLELNADKPLAIPARKSGRFGLTPCRKFTMPAHLDAFRDTNDTQPVALQAQAVAIGELGGVEPGRRLEAWETGFLSALDAGEERLVCLVQPLQNLLFGRMAELAVLLVEPPDFLQGRGLLVVGDRDASLAVSINAAFQRSVVEPAKAQQHFVQLRGLRGCRIDAVLVRADHLFALLGFDVSPDNGFRNTAYSASEVAPTPKGRQTAFQERELVSQDARRCSFEPVHYLRSTRRRVGLNEHMHMIRHDLKRVQCPSVRLRNSRQNLFQARINGRDKNLPSVLWAPDKVIFQAENSPGVFGVLTHAVNYTSGGYLSITHKGEAAIPLPAKAGSPLAA